MFIQVPVGLTSFLSNYTSVRFAHLQVLKNLTIIGILNIIIIIQHKTMQINTINSFHDNGGQWITQQRLKSNQNVLALIPLVGKFRLRLIELTSFKSKLLILNKTIYDVL